MVSGFFLRESCICEPLLWRPVYGIQRSVEKMCSIAVHVVTILPIDEGMSMRETITVTLRQNADDNQWLGEVLLIMMYVNLYVYMVYCLESKSITLIKSI